MSNDQRIELLEHRVRELQTAVVAIVQHLGLQPEIAALERVRLEEIRLTGQPDVPRERLLGLYSKPEPS